MKKIILIASILSFIYSLSGVGINESYQLLFRLMGLEKQIAQKDNFDWNKDLQSIFPMGMSKNKLFDKIGAALLKLNNGKLTLSSSPSNIGRARSIVAIYVLTEKNETVFEFWLTFGFTENNQLMNIGGVMGGDKESFLESSIIDVERALEYLNKQESNQSVGQITGTLRQ